MGGDFGPRSIVQASLACLSATPSLHLTLVGQPSLLEELISGQSAVDRARLSITPASEVITMDEKPAQALRGKPDSSMRVALELLRDGKVQACVSAGNTGALMALSRFVLKTLPGIDRPAMVAAIPTQKGYCQLLDLGANVDCSAEHLLQFAVMGSVAAETLGIVRPRVALLNIGTEDIKGNQQVKLAATLLQSARGINYIGFVEGDGLYRGEADVVVCDGFVGNILLKSSEGLATMIAGRIEALFKKNLRIDAVVGALALPLMKRLQADLAPARHNGASFLGLQGIVVKSHGSAGVQGFQSAISARLDRDPGKPAGTHSRSPGGFVALGVFVGQCLNVTAWFNWPSNCQFLASPKRDVNSPTTRSLGACYMSASLAFVFPGQGSQSLGMLAELGAQHPVVLETFKEASDALGYDLWALTQQGPEEQLNQTDKTQPAILTASIALWRLWLAEGGARPAYVAGHSLGEYSALVAAGSLSLGDAVKLVERRGQLMQEAVPAGQGGMAAILGLDDADVLAACAEAAQGEVVSAVNFNSPGRWSSPVPRLRSSAPSKAARPVVPSAPCRCRSACRPTAS